MNTLDNLIKEIEGKLTTFNVSPGFEDRGVVLEVGDGVASILGLGRVGMGEEVLFEGGVRGQIIGLEEDKAWAIVFGDYEDISEGSKVRSTGETLKVGVTDSLLGRVVDPLLTPLDGKGAIKSKKFLPIEKIAPGVTQRAPVNTPLRTGVKVVDALIPIGRGQRELIIGDRSTGKTSLALDTILNQEDVICIYVAIGQKQSNVAQIYAQLAQKDNFIIVSATSAVSPSLQYIAPYVGTTIGEYFMEKGKDVLIVYDDLTKHAWAYRQISLVLKKPSGREAYPGDIFYLHSRLLERSCKLNKENGGGSVTALPIVETHAGDITTYIPTNIISITDGQIFLESDLFYAGVRPAVNVGLSVSRVGGAAQTKKIKTVSGPLRLELAQYRELAGFAQFGSDLDIATRDKLDRGARITQVLKQPQNVQVTEVELVILLFAVTNGYLDDVQIEKCTKFEKEMFGYLHSNQKNLVNEIDKAPVLTDDLTKKLKQVLEKFKNTFKD